MSFSDEVSGLVTDIHTSLSNLEDRLSSLKEENLKLKRANDELEDEVDCRVHRLAYDDLWDQKESLELELIELWDQKESLELELIELKKETINTLDLLTDLGLNRVEIQLVMSRPDTINEINKLLRRFYE